MLNNNNNNVLNSLYIGMCEKREAHQTNYMSVYMRKEMKHGKKDVLGERIKAQKRKNYIKLLSYIDV